MKWIKTPPPKDLSAYVCLYGRTSPTRVIAQWREAGFTVDDGSVLVEGEIAAHLPQPIPWLGSMIDPNFATLPPSRQQMNDVMLKNQTGYMKRNEGKRVPTLEELHEKALNDFDSAFCKGRIAVVPLKAAAPKTEAEQVFDHHDVSPAKTSPERRAPVQGERGFKGPGTIPWSTHMAICAKYLKLYHGDQTPEEIANRGGFGYREGQMLLAGHLPSSQCSDELPELEGWEPR